MSTQAYPVGEFPKNLALDNPTYDPSKLTAALKKAGLQDGHPRLFDGRPQQPAGGGVRPDRTVGRGAQRQLHGVPIAQAFNYASTPASQVPNLFIWTVNPDDSHPDSWIRIFSNTNGSLNELHGSVPAADR